MLVLSRRLQESITIDGKVVVTVTKISGNRVSLSFAAARQIPIIRSETLQPVDLSECPPLPDDEDEIVFGPVCQKCGRVCGGNFTRLSVMGDHVLCDSCAAGAEEDGDRRREELA